MSHCLLVVDDHLDTCRMLRRLLERSGYQVRIAGSVGEARDLASDGGCNLVISDVGLPDGSGVDLMRDLATMYGLRGVALSGFGEEQDVRRSIDAGFAIHLTKPIAFDQLLEAVQSLLPPAAAGSLLRVEPPGAPPL